MERRLLEGYEAGGRADKWKRWRSTLEKQLPQHRKREPVPAPRGTSACVCRTLCIISGQDFNK